MYLQIELQEALSSNSGTAQLRFVGPVGGDTTNAGPEFAAPRSFTASSGVPRVDPRA